MLGDQLPLSERLRQLHMAYVFKVNAAFAQDQLDRVTELTDAYFDDAQQAISGAASPPGPQG